MSIIVPNTASSLASSGCVPGSERVFAWIGLTTGSVSGSVCWYATNASTSGCEIMGIALLAQQQAIFGPFNSPCGLYAAGVNGGCALVMLKLP